MSEISILGIFFFVVGAAILVEVFCILCNDNKITKKQIEKIDIEIEKIKKGS